MLWYTGPVRLHGGACRAGASRSRLNRDRWNRDGRRYHCAATLAREGRMMYAYSVPIPMESGQMESGRSVVVAVVALAVGTPRDDDGGFNRGAVWVLFLDGICLWDLDGNRTVGVSDLLTVLVNWGPCP